MVQNIFKNVSSKKILKCFIFPQETFWIEKSWPTQVHLCAANLANTLKWAKISNNKKVISEAFHW